ERLNKPSTMKTTLILAFFAGLAAFASASIHAIGHVGHLGALVGPSGVVTAHGAIGPVGNSLAWGHGWGHGLWGHGHGVAVIGPHAEPAVIAGPAGKIIADGVWGHHGHHW
ncbi:UNVERIFIED_CONTAM: hypothetical protein M9610_24305, partial [Salmonella sp. NW982]